MKHTFSIVITACLTLMVCACAPRSTTITQRAYLQLPVSFRMYLNDYGMYADSLEISDTGTVYENDSLSIIQFSAFLTDADGETKVLDYRYIYLYDRMMSSVYKRPVFNESFENILRMTDEEIEKLATETEKEGTSIYMLVFGQTSPVKYPYDIEKTK